MSTGVNTKYHEPCLGFWKASLMVDWLLYLRSSRPARVRFFGKMLVVVGDLGVRVFTSADDGGGGGGAAAVAVAAVVVMAVEVAVVVVTAVEAMDSVSNRSCTIRLLLPWSW